jgi:hypothetical protein
MTTPPTPQAIAAILRKAGFERAEDLPGGGNTRGYRVIRNRNDDGVVLVNWWEHSSYADDHALQAHKLKRYAEAITAAGYAVRNGYHVADHERLGYGADYLIVTTPPSASGEAVPPENKERDQ